MPPSKRKKNKVGLAGEAREIWSGFVGKIEINDSLIRKAQRFTGLKTKRQIVERALDLLVRSESRKGILKYYGSGVWQSDLKTSRRNRV